MPRETRPQAGSLIGDRRLWRFHFGFQTSVTQRHPSASIAEPSSRKRSYWITLGDAGCRFRRTENPRVDGSIPPGPPSRSASCDSLSLSFHSVFIVSARLVPIRERCGGRSSAFTDFAHKRPVNYSKLFKTSHPTRRGRCDCQRCAVVRSVGREKRWSVNCSHGIRDSPVHARSEEH